MSKKINSKLITEIQKLRSHGWSINKIYKKYDLGYGTIYKYIKDIKILPEYINNWKKSYMGSTIRMNRDIKIAQKKASKLIKTLNNKEKILFLTALYWGEGAKKDLNITNGDPELIKVFINGIRSCLKIPNSKIKINIRVFEDMDREKCIEYWLKITSLKRENLSSIDILKGKKNGKLKYGICRLRVLKGGIMLKYFKAVKEEAYKNF